jgi:hypothetical protein
MTEEKQKSKAGRKPTGAKSMTISLLPMHIELLKQYLETTGQSYSETIRQGIVLATKRK